MSDAPAKKPGIDQVLGLMDSYGLTPGDVKKAHAEVKKAKKRADSGQRELNKSEMVLRLFLYLGGTLIFAGLGVFIHTIWDSIDSFARVTITFGSGFTAYLCGLFFAADKRFEKAATPAFILAFLLQPTGLFVLLKEYFDGNDAALGSMLVFGPLFLQQALTFLKFRRPALLLFSLLYLIGLAGAKVEYFDIDRGFASLAFGLFLFLTTCHMQMRQAFKELTPVFFIFGSGLFLGGVYYYLGRTNFDPLILSIVLSMLWFALLKESKTLYVLSLLYVGGYFIGGPGGGWRMWDDYHELTAIVTGSSLMLTGHWLRRSSYISLHPVWMFLGAMFALGGAYSMVHSSMIEPLYAGVSALAIYGALLLRSRAVLAAAVISLISFIVSYSAEHFANTVGWPLLLIFIGFITLGCGFLFAKLSGRIKASA
jgi:hypothetical protein